MNRQTVHCLIALDRLGFSLDDALTLRRISMTLHRWHELECGDDSGHIERGENGEGKPYMVRWNAYSGKEYRYLVADRERGALKRLDAIMARYPEFRAYVQGDPRGAALYIYRADDARLKDSKYGIESIYSSIGTAVYK